MDEEWSAFVGQYGRMSWSRLSDPSTRLQVGMNFMLNVATLDPGCFSVSPLPSMRCRSNDAESERRLSRVDLCDDHN